MLAIYKKELKSYLHSVLGCLFMAVILFFVGLYFTVYCLAYGTPYYSYVLNGVAVIFLFSVPILTMKILADERRQKTDQMLFTSPIKVSAIIMGKYFALISILFAVTVVAGIYPFILSFFGKVPLVETYVAILGFYLFGCACIAIGVFFSAVTENQVIAAVLTFGTLLLGFMVSNITSIISSTGNMLTKILSVFDFSARLNSLYNGVFDLTAILYYLSIIVIFLFLTYQIIQKRRWTVVNYGILKGVANIFVTMIMIAVIVGCNIGVSFVPKTITNLDVTNEKLYSITDTTKKLLDSLDSNITIYMLNSKEKADINIKEMLNKYDNYSSKISVVYKDPTAFPNFTSTYTDEELSANSLIIEGAKKSTTVAYNDCFETQMDPTTYASTATGFDGEGQLTSAIDYVIKDTLPKLYVIAGHEEFALSDSLMKQINKENIEVETLNLVSCEAIPEDAACIAMVGPVVDYSNEDTQKIKDYLGQGGHAILLSAMSDQDMPNFQSILSDYGVTTNSSAVVFEGDSSKYSQYPFYILPTIESNTITSDLAKGNRTIILPQAISYKVADTLPDGVTVTNLLTSSDASYSKENVTTMTTYDKELGNASGPFTLGILVEKTGENSKTKLIAFSCEYLVADEYNEMVSGANFQMFTDSLCSLTDSKSSSVSIPVKEYKLSAITLSQKLVVILGFVTTILIPLIILITGIIIWAKRRKR